MIVGTAGHIDHGKTSLIKALTGIDTDRLAEEKRRGITIELGFAYIPLPDGGTIGFVDVPGHERLVHTMIAGAASIDLALLVIAADDGVMPQTREHLAILELLGITEAIVALSKADLADEDRRVEVELDIHALLETTPFAGAPVIPVSATTGEGIAALRDTLTQAAQHRAMRAATGAFRLAVDRSFSLAGVGTVVTGSVLGGRVAVGDSVLLLPAGQGAKIRSLHAQNHPAEQGLAGERRALNLQGPGIHKDSIGRGDWVVEPSQHAMTARFDAEIRLLDDEATELRAWAPVMLHHGAGQVAARIVPLEANALAPGAVALAQIVLDQPRPFRHGDRIVLRDPGARRTIGGGRVLDPRAPERRRRAPARLALLHALRAPTQAEALAGVLALPPYVLNLDRFAIDHALAAPEAARLATNAGALALPDGPWIIAPAALARLRDDAAAALGAHHARDPDSPGLTAEALRLALPTRLPREAFAPLLARLRQDGAVAQDGHRLRAPQHTPGLGGEDSRLWSRVEPLLADPLFRPPRVRELAAALGLTDIALRRACKGFARAGHVTEVAPDQFFLRSAIPQMAQAAEALTAEAGLFTAAQFRDRLKFGRTLAIQVLEYFDRRGLTVRRGDLRRTVKPAAAVFGTPDDPR